MLDQGEAGLVQGGRLMGTTALLLGIVLGGLNLAVGNTFMPMRMRRARRGERRAKSSTRSQPNGRDSG